MPLDHEKYRGIHIYCLDPLPSLSVATQKCRSTLVKIFLLLTYTLESTGCKLVTGKVLLESTIVLFLLFERCAVGLVVLVTAVVYREGRISHSLFFEGGSWSPATVISSFVSAGLLFGL
jgi:hypothetical protein